MLIKNIIFMTLISQMVFSSVVLALLITEISCQYNQFYSPYHTGSAGVYPASTYPLYPGAQHVQPLYQPLAYPAFANGL